jgi:hypothetical protein
MDFDAAFATVRSSQCGKVVLTWANRQENTIAKGQP